MRNSWDSRIHHSDEVRRFFIENALYWQREFHLDGLRLDAVHALRDFSATPFLQELVRATREQALSSGRAFFLIAESDLNDPRLIRPESAGGLGLDAQWSDDFHHALHVLLTGERTGYYQDFGGVDQLAKVLRLGYAYTGEYSKYRKRRHGCVPQGTSLRQFVVYSQNHDQIGNRLLGDRLASLLNYEQLKLAAGAVLLSPSLPMLFMGEEYGQVVTFQYFTSHTDPALVQAVQRGRREEFAAFNWHGPVPDPNAAGSFESCVLSHESCKTDPSRSTLRSFYAELMRLRKDLLTPTSTAPEVHTFEPEQVLLVRYALASGAACVFLAFDGHRRAISAALCPGLWTTLLDSAAELWRGPGSIVPGEISSSCKVTLDLPPHSVTVLRCSTP